MTEGFSWTCPFCKRPVTITEESLDTGEVFLTKENADGFRDLACVYVVCPNEECRRFSLAVTLSTATWSGGPQGRWIAEEELKKWQLIPPSQAKSFPDYIPKPILNDYEEACLIKDVSPKASATLARRCLQGIIRDFWGIRLHHLRSEIAALEGKVDPLTWQAIDAVRTVGNIGAHMEKDTNVILDVDPKEAELLIGLIETLLEDWYIAREEKKVHLSKLVEIAEDKKAARRPKVVDTENAVNTEEQPRIHNGTQ